MYKRIKKKKKQIYIFSTIKIFVLKMPKYPMKICPYKIVRKRVDFENDWI